MDEKLNKSPEASQRRTASDDRSVVRSPPIRRPVLRASIVIAGFAWIVLIISIYLRERSAILVGVAGWPIIYGLWLGMASLMASFCSAIDKSFIYGPAKDLQIRLLRGPMVWWVNAVILIAPLAVLVVGVLGLLGILPTDK